MNEHPEPVHSFFMTNASHLPKARPFSFRLGCRKLGCRNMRGLRYRQLSSELPECNGCRRRHVQRINAVGHRYARRIVGGFYHPLIQSLPLGS